MKLSVCLKWLIVASVFWVGISCSAPKRQFSPQFDSISYFLDGADIRLDERR